MYKDVNEVRLTGRLGRDIELKYAKSGTAIANFSIGTTISVKKGDKYEDQTEWTNIVVFGRLAEILAEKAGKGSRLYVAGRLQTRAYTTKDGVEKKITEVLADFQGIKLLEAQGSSSNSAQNNYDRNVAANAAQASSVDDDDSDLPF